MTRLNHVILVMCCTFSLTCDFVKCLPKNIRAGDDVFHRRLPRNAADFDNEIEEQVGRLSQIRGIIRQAKQVDGSINLNRLLQDQIRDPVPIADFNVSNSGILTDIKGHFSDMQLFGLKRFRVDRMQINLSGMDLSADMFIPTLSVVGDYRLDGSVMFMQVSGDGGFWMNLTGISITGHSRFEPNEESGRLRMDEVQLQSEVADIELHFENLMGGGTWSRISNTLLNQLSELILDELKHTLLAELGKFLRTQFNDHLFENLPEDLVDPETSNIVDSVIKKVSDMVTENGLDPLPLPDHEAKFERSMLFFTTKGEVCFSNGNLHGLSSLSRRGDVILVLANDSIMFEAAVGFDNLTGTFDWEAKLFDFGPEGSVHIQIKSVDGFLRFRQHLGTSGNLELESFYIKNIRHIWLDIEGLGTWDYLMEIIANVVTNGLKLKIADAITGPVKANIQKELNALNFTMD